MLRSTALLRTALLLMASLRTFFHLGASFKLYGSYFTTLSRKSLCPMSFPSLFERDDGRARAALGDVGELEALDIPVAPEVLVDALPEGSRALAVDDQDL